MLPALAAAATLCGPAHADTLAQGAAVRVYSTRGAAVACHRRGGKYRLGVARRVLGVRVAGRHAAVRRRDAAGESLRVYDVRRHRPVGFLTRRTAFTALALDPGGVAAFVADGQVGDTLEGRYRLPTQVLDRGFVRIRGPIVAWREGSALRIGQVTDDRPVVLAWRAGPLLRGGETSIALRRVLGGVRLVARRAGTTTTLGAPIGACDSPSDCFGVETVIAAGRYVGVYDAPRDFTSADAGVRLLDLVTGTQSRPCPRSASEFTLTEDGRVTCGSTR